MIFSRTSLLSAAALALIAACGGDNAPKTSQAQNSVENSEVTAASSADAPTPEAEVTATETDMPDFSALPEPYNSADYARGRRTFKLCQSCHTLAEGAPNLVGPNLYGLFGRHVGAVEGFAYSSAVTEADFVWSPEKLDEWLTSPRDFLPGNKMSFAGVRKPEDRLAVIAYIMLETGYADSNE